jgi:hypothetical protein
MPLQVDQVLVGAFGNIFVADAGTALPANYTAAVAAIAAETTFKSLGYVDENGISFTSGKTQTDIPSWQTADPIRTILTGRTGSFTAALMQINESTLPFALGGGAWTQGSGDQFVFEFPLASDAAPEHAMLIDVTGDVTTQWVRGAAAKLPLTVSLLADATALNIGRIVGSVPVTVS